jgi:F-type H+-transporting ATPase subunit epsilon
MNLKILLPFQIFAQETGVSRIVVDTADGEYGLLPRRLDCVAALVPGILTYEKEGSAPVYVAVDVGLMVKAGEDVLVSVRHAVGGTDLGQLHEAVKRDFLKVDDDERDVRAALAKMEGGFVRRIAEYQHAR